MLDHHQYRESRAIPPKQGPEVDASIQKLCIGGISDVTSEDDIVDITAMHGLQHIYDSTAILKPSAKKANKV